MSLARSCHDMAKQMYANKKYSDVAWSPLRTYLHNDNNTGAKLMEMQKFNRNSTEFFDAVAQCLWNLANAPNVPWGRKAKQTAVFDAIPTSEKVHRLGIWLLFFFLSFFLHRIIYDPCSPEST